MEIRHGASSLLNVVKDTSVEEHTRAKIRWYHLRRANHRDDMRKDLFCTKQ